MNDIGTLYLTPDGRKWVVEETRSVPSGGFGFYLYELVEEGGVVELEEHDAPDRDYWTTSEVREYLSVVGAA